MPRDAPCGLPPASLLLAIEDAVRREQQRRRLERLRAGDRPLSSDSDEEGARRLAERYKKEGYL
jgi:hypothetical protein